MTTNENQEHSEDLVSILMPAFNCADYVEQAIQSILLQTHSSLELLVVDDSSTDGTWEVIERVAALDSRVQVSRNADNQGYLKTCNDLVEKAKGLFVGFQDADDWSAPDRISAQIRLLKKHPEIELCGTNFYRVKDGAIVGGSSYQSDPEGLRANILGGRVFICGATVLVRADLIKKYGLYREFFDRIGGEHHDWIARISDHHGISNVSERLYYYRSVQGSITGAAVNPRSYGSGRIISFLARQRQLRGGDALQGVDVESFNSILAEIDSHYSDLFFLSRHRILVDLQDAQLGHVIRGWVTMVRAWPIRLDTYVLFARIILSRTPDLSMAIENLFFVLKKRFLERP